MCVCVHACMHVYVCINMYKCVHGDGGVCAVCVCACVCVCNHLCMYVKKAVPG